MGQLKFFFLENGMHWQIKYQFEQKDNINQLMLPLKLVLLKFVNVITIKIWHITNLENDVDNETDWNKTKGL